MSIITSNVLAGASGQAGAGGYQIPRSVRFNSADSSFLSRVPGTASNRKTFSFAAWVKKVNTGTALPLLNARQSANDFTNVWFDGGGELWVNSREYGANNFYAKTAAVFRDPSAWYHVLIAIDTTQASGSDGLKVYVNGTQQTLTIYTYNQNANTYINSTHEHRIGYLINQGYGEYYLNSYLADIHFIEQALTPSSFGEFDATTGVWNPIEYTGSYGTNGFHLDFSDNSTAAALGTDTSSNGNTFTVNNLTASSLYSSAGFTNPANAFDGNAGTLAEINVAAGLGTIVFTSGISVSSSITINYTTATSGNIFVNGSATVMQGTGSQTQTISFSGTLSTLGLQSGSQPVLYYVQIDGGGYLTGANAIDTDSLVDTPTNYGTDSAGVGGEVRGNYATLNPLQNASADTFSNGNLQVATSSANYGTHTSTIATPLSGKWYAEITVSSHSGWASLGLVAADSHFTTSSWPGGLNGVSYYALNGAKFVDASQTSYGATFGNGDVIGIAYDADNSTVVFYKNGVSQGTIGSVPLREYYFGGSDYDGVGSATFIWNFGQRPWVYAAPANFKALCTTNLPAPTIENPSTVFDTKLYTGNGSTQTISGLNFSPDLVWIKSRSAGTDHALYDVVRGTQARLESNRNDAEATSDSGLTAFNSDGFALSTLAQVNTSSATYVAWTWDAGSSTVTNNDGSITSQVRANASAGFSVVTYTGNGNNATVGHGLNAVPALVITKDRSATNNWLVVANITGYAGSGYLNLTNAFTNRTLTYTSATFRTLNASEDSNNGANYVAYCFAPVAGYSSFGSYTGNGSADGPFVYTGFRPRWIITKSYNSGSSSGWTIHDTARSTANQSNEVLRAAYISAETTNTSSGIDILSNGFKLKADTAGYANYTGWNYIYYAVAENPFATARAR